MATWNEGVVYLRTTNKEGQVTHTTHQCWDRERFVRSNTEAAVKVGGKVEQITPADYAKAMERFKVKR